jgi:head-tail adaptor
MKFLARVQTPGPPTPDGEGGFTESWVDVDPPTWWCAIENAAARNLERVVAKTIEASATHMLRGDYHPAITTVCRILVPDVEDPATTKRYDVTSVAREHEGRRHLIVFAAEYITDNDPRPRRAPVGV